MSNNRFATARFCDDVRQEVGNKFSLMGCYGGELLVDHIPAGLPKLCVEINLLTPKGHFFEKAIVRARLNDEVIAELDLPVQDAKKTIPTDDPTASRMGLRAVMNFSPFVIEREGLLTVDVETEDEVLKAGRLKLMLLENYQKQREASKSDAPGPSLEAD